MPILTPNYGWPSPWDGSSYTFANGANFNPAGGWQVGARPSGIEVTFSCAAGVSVSLNLNDGVEAGQFGYLASTGSVVYSAGVHVVLIPISGQTADLINMYVHGGSGITLTAIRVVGLGFWTDYVSCAES